MKELPSKWHEVELGSLGFEVKGNEMLEPGRKHELYSVPAYDTLRPELVDGSEVKSGKRPVKPGDLLICKINPRINRVWIVSDPVDSKSQFASTEYLVFRLPTHTPEIERRFVMWYLRSPRFRSWIKLNVEGATGSHTRAKSPSVLRQTVPIAPPDQQPRIVEVIEEQFSRLDAGVESLQRAKRNLVGLRSSLLDAEIGRGWPVARLEALVSDLRYGTSIKCTYEGSGIPVLRIPNVRNGRIDIGDLKRAQSRELDLANATVRAGDLLFIRTNGSRELIGTVGLVESASAGLAFASYLIRARPNSSVVPSFLQIALSSPQLRAEIMRRAATSAGQYNISAKSLGTLGVPLPPPDEQTRIVAEVDRQFSIIDAMSKTIDAGLQRASTLRQSILSQAFSGKLTGAA